MPTHVTYPEDVAIAAEAITAKTSGACADSLAAPHCPAGSLGEDRTSLVSTLVASKAASPAP